VYGVSRFCTFCRTHTESFLLKRNYCCTSDVWLTVHRSSMWNKKPIRCHLVLYLFLLYKLLSMFRATLCPSSGADDLVVFLPRGVVPWLCRQSDPVGWLCGHTTSQPDLTAYTATALHHAAKTPLSRQILRMGTRWTETC